MANEPDFKCVKHPFQMMTWCGIYLRSLDGSFTDVNHAAENALCKGRLLICSDCSAEIVKTIIQGTFER